MTGRQARADVVPFSQPPALKTNAAGPISVEVADIDSDTNPDVVAVSRDNSRVAWFKYNSNSDDWSETIINNGSSANPVGLALGLIDEDSDIDVVVGATDTGKIDWYSNPGNGSANWSRVTIDNQNDADQIPDTIAIADVDGDGDNDVIVAFRMAETLYWYTNPRIGSNTDWTKKPIASDLPGPRSVIVADIDGDTNPATGVGLDILIGSSVMNNDPDTDGNILWYEQTAVDVWSQRVIDSDDLGANLVLVNLDGDGDDDVVAALRAQDQIVWYQNPQNENISNWTRTVIASNLGEVRHVAVADIDGDGDQDIYSAAVADDQISWHDNPEIGSNTQWVTHEIATGADGAAYIETEDFDRDGDPDAVAAAFFGNLIAWYRNDRSNGVLITLNGQLINSQTDLSVTEAAGAGHTLQLGVALNSAPTADVILPLTSSNENKGILDKAQLTFTIGNWNAPQLLTISGVDNAIDDNDTAFQLILGEMQSTDGDYDGSNPDDVAITSIDNDTAGVTVGPISNATSETGITATFDVVLTSEPTADVTIAVASLDSGEGTLNKSSLLFTAANWNSPQTVTVTGVDDDIDDGNVTYPIQVGPITTGDAKYTLINPDDITNAVNQDDSDSAGFSVTPVSSVTTEAGGTASFTVRLTSRPDGNAGVSVGVSSSDTGEGTVDKNTLAFTNGGWNQNQTVTVTGQPDGVKDGDVSYSIVLTPAISGDSNYQGRDPADVALVNSDIDIAGFIVSAISGPTSESAGTATFTVRLRSQPMAGVTLALSSSDLSEGTVAPAALTFTAGNWSAARTVTVTGVDDDEPDGDIAYTVRLGPVTTSDADYQNLDPADIDLFNQDNDPPANEIFNSGFE